MIIKDKYCTAYSVIKYVNDLFIDRSRIGVIDELGTGFITEPIDTDVADKIISDLEYLGINFNFAEYAEIMAKYNTVFERI